MEKRTIIRVGIVDDHKIVSEGIRQLLEFDGGFHVAFEVGNGYDCIRFLEEKIVAVDVILLDINMPCVDGLEVLKIIREKQIDVKVIMLTMFDDLEFLQNAMNMGVQGYLLKDVCISRLSGVIKKVYKGETYIQPQLVTLLNNMLLNKEREENPKNLLTKREVQILSLVVKGKINKEIANELSISERTVKNHISNIFRKIDVNDRTQAAVYAIHNNIV